jgi:hypothetical protein
LLTGFCKAAGVLVPLIVIGVAARRAVPRSSPEEWFAGATVDCYLLVMLAFAWTFGYLSHRHMLPLVAVCLCWAGAGLAALRTWLSPLWPSEPAKATRRLGAVLGVLVAVALAVDALRPVRPDKSGLRTAGLWMRTHAKPNPTVMALNGAERVALYADATWLRAPEGADYGTLMADARQRRADYLVVESGSVGRTVKDFPVAAAPSTDLKLIHTRSLSRHPAGRQVLVFEVLSTPVSAP